jgi:hypothetical protein
VALIDPRIVWELEAESCEYRCQITSRLVAPKSITKKILRSLDVALDATPGVSMTVMPDPLMQGEYIDHARYVGRVTYWQAAMWRRYEIIISGLPNKLAEFYRIAESHYERS